MRNNQRIITRREQPMGELEEKISRLPPHLQQEVEDFVDYLSKRTEGVSPVASGDSLLAPLAEPTVVNVFPPDEAGGQQEKSVSKRHSFGDVITAAESDDSFSQKTGRPHPSKLLDWIE